MPNPCTMPAVHPDTERLAWPHEIQTSIGITSMQRYTKGNASAIQQPALTQQINLQHLTINVLQNIAPTL